MLWNLPFPWSENIKKRACRYLLQRYLGNFLEEKLTLDQLSVDLYNGTGTVSEVSLDCEALNELGDSQNWPLEIVDGYMQEITVTIPWSTLLKDDSVVQVNGLSLTVQPKVRSEQVPSMLESMWSSMSSSMQLAAECIQQENGPQDAQPVEGIELFAHAIDSILSRVKIRFVNTKIRIEHVPKNSDRGIALEIHINCIDYFDEAGSEPTPDVTDPEKPKTYIVSTYTNKKIVLEGISFYTDEFPSKMRTVARSLIMEKSSSSQAGIEKQIESDLNVQSTSSDIFFETRSSIYESETPKIDADESLHRSTTPKRDHTPDERPNLPDPILFAQITGRQELAMKIKHTEEAIGPKVDLQVTLGTLIVFLTPRQLHTLIELVDGINQPDMEDRSNIKHRTSSINMQCKPMRPADFQLIEAQILGNFSPESNRKTAFGMCGWTGQNYDGSEVESERFHPMSGAGNKMSDSFSSSVSSMNTSVTSSVNLITAQPGIKRNRKVPQIDGDPTAEVSRINIKMSSCSCILLHRDILLPLSLAGDCVSPASAKRLQETSTQFFAKLGFLSICGEKKQEFDIANDIFDKAADSSHLRLVTGGLILEGSEKSTAHGSLTSCEFGIDHLLLRECVYYRAGERVGNPEAFDLVKFDWKDDNDDENESMTSNAAAQPNVRITFKQTLKYQRIAGEKKLQHPTTDLCITCMPFYVDVDLTLLERITASLNGGSGAANTSAPRTAQNQFNFTLQCANLDGVIRFPIADLRPGVYHEARRVRTDYLLLKFADVLVSCQQAASARALPTTLTIRATTLDLYYYENENSEGTYIARASMDDSYDMLRGTLSALPTISLTFKPSQSCRGPFDPLSDDEACLEPMSNPMTMSMHILDNLRGSTQPSPFSSKKMLHQSITKHEDSPGGQIDELVVPGNEEEMAEFTNSSVERAAIHLDLNLPVLSLQLESKQIYEILYNHINSDLLLWEPQVVDPFEINPLAACAGPNIYPAFSVCAPGYDSDSASTSSEENLYFSTYDHKVRQQKMNAAKKEEKKDSHNFCFTLQVTKGLVTIYTPVRDSNKRVVPNQMGELVIQASKLSMCHVSGLNGHAKTAQLCLRAAKAALYHDAQQTVPVDKPTLRLHGTRLPAHLQETIYPSGSGVLLKEKVSAKDMLSLALRVDPQLDMPNYKKVCMAMGIDNATLRHRGAVGIAWLSQLLDVLDVIDYPVPGYQPSTVLTELHVHLANCAIDYRPLYLPIRCVLTLGNFSVSSNVLAESNTSCLRFVAQECGVFVARVCGVKPCEPVPQDDGKRPDVMKDYVCVMDLGLFELSVRIADKASSSGPHIDLSASNNIVNIHSCWDSASAVCHLLTYVASDGDCQPPYDRSTRNTSFSSERASEPQLVGLENHPEDIRELSPSEIQQVNDLMAEAMKESPNTTLEEDEINSSTEKQGVELFYFPDESNPPKARPSAAANEEDSASVDSAELSVEAAPVEAAEEATPQSVHVARELGDPSAPARRPKKPARTKKHQTAETSNTDDEFCIIESQTSGVEDDLAEPTVHWFGNEPVSVVENYFTVPAARSDVLKAPKSFPLPTLRYTLCEMSIVWHLFGGNDFSTPGPVVPSTPKKVTINEGDSRHGSPTTAKRNVEYEPYEASLAVTSAYRQTGVRWSAGSERVRQAAEHSLQKTSWRKKGGAQRDTRTCVQMCLNKVKFQHETYPSGGSHASRQTLAISKIEILDRLANSHINKFLSQYKMKDEPERTNAYMLVIKSVHLRPEPSQPAQECCLKVSLLPLRFNIDQDTLAFLVGFFSKLGSDDNSDEDSIGGLSSDSNSRHTTPTHRPPVMSVAREPTSNTSTPLDGNSLHEEPLLETYEAERLVSENLIQLEEDFQKLGVGQTPEVVPEPDTEAVDDSPIYFRRVVFSPEVPIRLDYVGKRVDLSAGPVAGLLMGLGQLNCSELRLKRLHHRHGLLGLERLVKWVLQEWLKDIKRHQLPGLLSGIGPMHSLLQIVSGIRDLIWLPLQQWRRDGRLVHGLKRGAASFTARTAVAALDITARILHVIQATAETAFDMLTPGPTLQLQDAYDRRERRRRRRHDPSRHPTDYKEGVQSAYNLVKEGIAETAATITIAARSESGVAMLRHLPGAAVTPLALAVAGAADVLGGVRASLAPDLNRDIADKWRPRTDHFDN